MDNRSYRTKLKFTLRSIFITKVRTSVPVLLNFQTFLCIAFSKEWRFDFLTFTPILTTRENHVREITTMCKIVSKAILRLLFLTLNNFRLLFVTK